MEHIELIKVWKDGDFALVDPDDKQRFLDAGWAVKAQGKVATPSEKVEVQDEIDTAPQIEVPETLEKSAALETPKPIKRGRSRKS